MSLPVLVENYESSTRIKYKYLQKTAAGSFNCFVGGECNFAYKQYKGETEIHIGATSLAVHSVLGSKGEQVQSSTSDYMIKVTLGDGLSSHDNLLQGKKVL